MFPPCLGCVVRKGLYRLVFPPCLGWVVRKDLYRLVFPLSLGWVVRKGLYHWVFPPCLGCVVRKGPYRLVFPPCLGCVMRKGKRMHVQNWIVPAGTHLQPARRSPSTWPPSHNLLSKYPMMLKCRVDGALVISQSGTSWRVLPGSVGFLVGFYKRTLSYYTVGIVNHGVPCNYNGISLKCTVHDICDVVHAVVPYQ